MQFIGNVEDIEKDILANLIYDKLSSLILDEKQYFIINILL